MEMELPSCLYILASSWSPQITIAPKRYQVLKLSEGHVVPKLRASQVASTSFTSSQVAPETHGGSTNTFESAKDICSGSTYKYIVLTCFETPSLDLVASPQLAQAPFFMQGPRKVNQSPAGIPSLGFTASSKSL